MASRLTCAVLAALFCLLSASAAVASDVSPVVDPNCEDCTSYVPQATRELGRVQIGGDAQAENLTEGPDGSIWAVFSDGSVAIVNGPEPRIIGRVELHNFGHFVAAAGKAFIPSDDSEIVELPEQGSVIVRKLEPVGEQCSVDWLDVDASGSPWLSYRCYPTHDPAKIDDYIANFSAAALSPVFLRRSPANSPDAFGNSRSQDVDLHAGDSVFGTDGIAAIPVAEEWTRNYFGVERSKQRRFFHFYGQRFIFHPMPYTIAGWPDHHGGEFVRPFGHLCHITGENGVYCDPSNASYRQILVDRDGSLFGIEAGTERIVHFRFDQPHALPIAGRLYPDPASSPNPTSLKAPINIGAVDLDCDNCTKVASVEPKILKTFRFQAGAATTDIIRGIDGGVWAWSSAAKSIARVSDSDAHTVAAPFDLNGAQHGAASGNVFWVDGGDGALRSMRVDGAVGRTIASPPGSSCRIRSLALDLRGSPWSVDECDAGGVLMRSDPDGNATFTNIPADRDRAGHLVPREVTLTARPDVFGNDGFAAIPSSSETTWLPRPNSGVGWNEIEHFSSKHGAKRFQFYGPKHDFGHDRSDDGYLHTYDDGADGVLLFANRHLCRITGDDVAICDPSMSRFRSPVSVGGGTFYAIDDRDGSVVHMRFDPPVEASHP